MVPAFGNVRRATDLFLDPRPQRTRQPIDLDPGIVDIELAGDFVASDLEQSADAVAQGRTATVTHVERPRRIRRDEFDVDPTAPPHLGAAEIRARGHDPAERVSKSTGRQPEIDESGTRDLYLRDQVRRQGQAGDDVFRQPAGGPFERSGKLQREVGGQIAVPRIPGPVEGDFGFRRIKLGRDVAECRPEPLGSGDQDSAPEDLAGLEACLVYFFSGFPPLSGVSDLPALSALSGFPAASSTGF
jgi:hypothetical protein